MKAPTLFLRLVRACFGSLGCLRFINQGMHKLQFKGFGFRVSGFGFRASGIRCSGAAEGVVGFAIRNLRFLGVASSSGPYRRALGTQGLPIWM